MKKKLDATFHLMRFPPGIIFHHDHLRFGTHYLNKYDTNWNEAHEVLQKSQLLSALFKILAYL